MTDKNRGTLLYLMASAFFMISFAAPAEAHVKWFFPYDVVKPPLPIGEIVDATFARMFGWSVAACYLFFLTDRFVYRQTTNPESARLWKNLAAFDQKLKRFDNAANYIMRVSAFAFALTLFLWWALGIGQQFFLTPELKTDFRWVPWLHLVMAVCALLRRTAPITGVGFFILWLGALSQYGIFHILDYPIFLGIGYYLATSTATSKGWLKSGLVVLFACTGITLLWASVEKFAYPSWTIEILQGKPEMLQGMTPQRFMKVSGFVEMFVTFILLGAASVVGRLIALGLMAVFVLAVFEFGPVDAVGHLMIVAILFVLIVRGPTDAREMLVLRTKNVFTEAYFMTGLYFLAFGMVFLLYFGIHYWQYGT